MSTVGFPLLTILVFLPVGGAILAALLPERPATFVAAIVSLGELGLVAYTVVSFPAGSAGFQYVSHENWISSFGISWAVGVDGISLFLVGMTALLFPVAIFGPSVPGNRRAYMGWMLLLEAACIGAFLSLDLFLFFVMFELTLVPGYFIVAGHGGPRRNYAAMKFFIYTFAGSAFFFVALLSLVLLVTPLNGGRQTFDLITVARLAAGLPHADQVLIFSGMAVAFAVKTPIVPFHTWLPDTYTEASAGGTMVISGVMFALGGYGLLRLGVFLVPRGAADMAPVLLTLATIGVVYGAVVTIMQRDLKRLVAYSAIVSVALVVLGEFAFSSQGVAGGVMQMVNESLTLGALFFLIGLVRDRTGSLRFADLGGLWTPAPILAAIFLVVVLSAVGLPGLNGFVSEFLVLAGTFITHRWWAVVSTTVIITGAVYLLWAYQKTFWIKVSPANRAVRDISWREIGMVAPLLAGIVFLGVYPRVFFDRVTPSVGYLLGHVQHVAPNADVPASTQSAIKYTIPANQNVDARPPSSGVAAGSHP